MTHSTRIFFATLFLALPYGASALSRSELLPDASFQVSVSGTTNFWNALKTSPFGKLWVDPEFQNFAGHLDQDFFKKTFLQGDTPNPEKEVFIEQVSKMTGEVALAFNEGQQNPCIVAAISQEDYAKVLELDEHLSEILEDNFDLVKSTFQDIEIVKFVPLSGKREPYWQAWAQDTLLVGWSREWVEKNLVALQKEKPEEPKGNPCLSLKINLRQLLQSWSKKEDGDLSPEDPDSFQRISKVLGLSGIGVFSMNVEMREHQMRVLSDLEVDDLNVGLFRLIDPTPSEIPQVPFLSADTSALEVGRINLAGLWKAIPEILHSLDPTIEQQFDLVISSFEQQTGLNFTEQILENLDTAYLSYSIEDEGVQKNLLGFELKDGQAFQQTIDSLMANPTVQPQLEVVLETESFLDQPIYLVKNLPPESAVAFAVSGSYLFYGHPDALRQAIRAINRDTPADKPFGASKLAQGLQNFLSPKAFGFSGIDWKKNMRLLIQKIQSQKFAEDFKQGWNRGAGKKIPPPDFSKLPPADHMASFFNRSYQQTQASPTGLHQEIVLEY